MPPCTCPTKSLQQRKYVERANRVTQGQAQATGVAWDWKWKEQMLESNTPSATTKTSLARPGPSLQEASPVGPAPLTGWVLGSTACSSSLSSPAQRCAGLTNPAGLARTAEQTLTVSHSTYKPSWNAPRVFPGSRMETGDKLGRLGQDARHKSRPAVTSAWVPPVPSARPWSHKAAWRGSRCGWCFSKSLLGKMMNILSLCSIHSRIEIHTESL